MPGRLAAPLLAALFLVLLANPAHAGAVILEGGDVLHGVVVEEGDHVVVEHAVLGRLAIPRSRVVEVHADGPPPTEAAGVVRAIDRALSLSDLRPRSSDVVHVAGDPCDPCPAPDPCDPCKGPWEIELGFAGSLATGNSETFDVQLDSLAKYSRGLNTFEAGLAYVYGEQEGERNAENWHGEVRFERKFTPRAYYFVQALYDRDDFADLQHRITLLAGVGAEVARSRYSVLKAEIGGGATFERRFGEDWTDDPTAYAGLDYAYEHPSGRKLSAELDFLPNLGDFDLSRTILQVRFDQPIGDKLSLSLGVRFEYVVDPPGDVEDLDTLLTAGLRLRL